jgi:excisionase family DNA binding protein
MSDSLESLLTLKEACQFLQISERTIHRLMRDRDPPLPFRRYGRIYRFSKQDLSDWGRPSDYRSPSVEPLLTIQEASQFLQVSVRTVRRFVNGDNPLPHHRVEGQLRFSRHDLSRRKRKREVAQ